jgi:hypothetical protein
LAQSGPYCHYVCLKLFLILIVFFFSYWPLLAMISLIIGMKFVALFLLSVHVLTKLLFGPQIRTRYWLIWRYGMFFLWHSTVISIIEMEVIIDYRLKRLVMKNLESYN